MSFYTVSFCRKRIIVSELVFQTNWIFRHLQALRIVGWTGKSGCFLIASRNYIYPKLSKSVAKCIVTAPDWYAEIIHMQLSWSCYWDAQAEFVCPWCMFYDLLAEARSVWCCAENYNCNILRLKCRISRCKEEGTWYTFVRGLETVNKRGCIYA